MSMIWNQRIYLITFIGDMSLMNIPGWGAGVRICYVDPYIRRTDEYKHCIFLLLPVLSASPDGESKKQANYTGINHTQHQYSYDSSKSTT
jgi:hypothetical protein